MPNGFPVLPVIPENITVHLGAPSNSSAPNVTVPFIDYIKNVASSEVYPTWPEEAIRANIYAQISFALNRIYTEYYRAQGRNFDITNTTAYDQAYVENRDIYENISRIVDDIFNVYISREGSMEPLFAQYCDGIRTTCNGLSQWGSVDLANDGLVPFEILQTYYGQDIGLISDARIESINESYPGRALTEGTISNDVQTIQVRLNRISRNYPAIPKINPADGVYGVETAEAVRTFQRIFNLEQTGVVAKGTWYRIISIYNAVKRLADINSEGIELGEVTRRYPNTELKSGDTGEYVSVFQYYLAVLGRFINEIPQVTITGTFDEQTENAVRQFQKYANLPVTGIVDRDTWNLISDYYFGVLRVLPPELTGDGALIYPGTALRLGSTGQNVQTIQEYINIIAASVPGIPTLDADGIFGPRTQEAVIALQQRYGLNPNGVVGASTWNAIINEWSDLKFGYQDVGSQYPGYPISEITANL